ncbi:putative bifunctional diguanylate cyclase/phosphodiesterase [Lichenicoccus sp.]|uniref:putative bifunctional diguanylate cyclase/phosphodiesterase n=1 Tax=Lichenicoccus sp. TaxID=2781899 RepID=UPI003D0DA2EB
MDRVRVFLSLFTVQSDDAELVLSQYRAVARQVPLLYSMLVLNTLALAATHLRSSPPVLTLLLPGLFVLASLARAARWRHGGKHLIDAPAALRALRNTSWFAPILGVSCLAWALALYPYGDDFAKAQVVYYISITAIACLFCLVHLRSAAFLVTLTVGTPSIIFFALTDQPVLIAISVNFLLVSICMVTVLLRQYRDFISLNDSRRHLLARQIETQRLSDANLRLAAIDTLTGLPNRRGFFSDLDVVLSRHQDSEAAIAVGLIDLDGFKAINDMYGHAAGDALLREVGLRIGAVATPDRCFARLGGDEFGFILTDCDDTEIQAFATALCLSLRASYDLPMVSAEIAASVGIAVFPRCGRTAAQLFERADYALYHAKQNQRGDAVLFSEVHQTEIRAAARCEQALRHADLETELSLHFQPIVDVATGATVAFECLARWTSPELGVVQPADFIKVAERSDLINRLTAVLLRKALAAARSWPEPMRIAFNLSVRDIASEESVRRICEIVRESGIAPARIDLEITETAVMRDFEQARQALLSLKELGVEIALDDFGTGYSSLSYVHRLPFDKIKVDRSFTADVETDPVCLNIVKSVLDLCRNLKLRCVVEGLETAAQVNSLKTVGGALMQGYFFARPMPAERVLAFLDKHPSTAPKPPSRREQWSGKASGRQRQPVSLIG